MANMSHCRFQNTVQDMQDCSNFIEANPDLVWAIVNGDDELPLTNEGEVFSSAEASALREFLDICGGIARDFSDDE